MIHEKFMIIDKLKVWDEKKIKNLGSIWMEWI